ncbi:MAG: ATP-dependent Clp protease ATP-binding subunit [Candidatus Nealsonbacteria bacterium]
MNQFNFNVKKSSIYPAVKWSGWVYSKRAKFVKSLIVIFFLFFFIMFSYGFLTQSFTDELNSSFFGLSLILFTFLVGAKIKTLFFNSKLKNPRLKVPLSEVVLQPKSYNLAEYLKFGPARAAFLSTRLARSKRMAELNSNVLFYFLITENDELKFVFSRLLLNFKDLKQAFKQEVKSSTIKAKKWKGEYSVDFQKTIIDALKIAHKNNKERIGMGELLSALAEHNKFFQKIIVENNLKNEDIGNLVFWLDSLKKRVVDKKRWWDKQNLMKKGTLAKEWTSGYTLTLDRYSNDWTEFAKKQNFPDVIGHDSEIQQVERVLGRREYNNVLLVGEPGIGKKAIIQGLTQKAVFGLSLPDVNYKRVVFLDLPSLLASIADPEEIELVLDKIFQEVVGAGNVILIIDEFHNFIGVQPGPGRIDISGIISSYLYLPQFQVVALSTFSGLHKNLEQNTSILNLFEKVEVQEISEREVMVILENLALVLEDKYGIFVTYPALREIISLTRRFMTILPFPKKAVDLLDEVIIYVKKSTKENVLLPSHVAKIISQKTQVPVGEMEVKEKAILLNLENLIHKRIINQQEAVREVSTGLRRSRAEVTVRKGPMGTFLFLGPTGVGKTETSKALAQIYFGGEDKTIRLDMSEFQEIKDINRLIGNQNQDGLLTTPVRENPFSLILLDEIEKAHPNVLNLFLQVLDEGFMTDGLGRKVDFKNTIIISTSNAGYQIILDALKQKTEWSDVKQKILDYVFEKSIFRPEFINRFDAVVVFQPLSKENLLDIAELMLRSLQKNLKQKGIDFFITLPLKEKIVDLGYEPAFGARQMRRVIQDKVENVLASALLSDKIKRGDDIEIDPTNFTLKMKGVE